MSEQTNMNGQLSARGDVTRDTLPLPSTGWHELAEQMLERFPVDRGQWLKELTALYFVELRHGNKREERAACDFLNNLQKVAVQIMEKRKV